MRLLLIFVLSLPGAALGSGVTVEEEGRRALVLDFRNDNEGGKNAGAVRLVTEVVASALADHEKLTVVTSKDLQRVLGLEAEKAVSGCNEDDGSCLAELGDALNAEFVVVGSVGALGELQVATVTVLQDLTTVDRFTVTGKPEELPALLEARIGQLLERLYPADDGTSTPSPEPRSELTALQWGGVGAAAAGAVVGLGSTLGVVFADRAIGSKGTSLEEKNGARVWGWISIAGVALGVASTGAGIGMFMTGGE